MSTYVISDIHGCYDEFLRMLDKIGFSDTDRLILAGDYIDRGRQSFEMLKWIEDVPQNVHLLRGNHEEEFVAYISLMCQIDKKEELHTDNTSNADAITLYETVKYFIKSKGISVSYFDVYGTIGSLLVNFGITLADLRRWADKVREMPFYYEEKICGRTYIVVHAGYIESLEWIGTKYSDSVSRLEEEAGLTAIEHFYLYAREESCKFGGKQHAVIVAGHTPTIAEDSFAYQSGNVFRYYDKKKDCTFYDIDCGCAFRRQNPDAKLACLRLEDEEIVYIK